MDRGARVIANLDSGYNCAESMVLAYADAVGASSDAVVRAATPFGGGLGRTGNVCGLISGAAMILGLAIGRLDPADEETKERAYARVAELIRSLEASRGSILCPGILGEDLADEIARTRAIETGEFQERCRIAAGEVAEILSRLLREREMNR